MFVVKNADKYKLMFQITAEIWQIAAFIYTE